MNANSEVSGGLGLAAVKLLLGAQAAGAHHQLTPMTRTPAASTPEQPSWTARVFLGVPGGEWASMGHVAVFFVALTALLSSALALAEHPIASVLLALGAMTLGLHALSELLHAPQIRCDPSDGDRAESD